MKSIHPREPVPADRECDQGPIPAPMLADLRHLLWTLEWKPRFWGIAMGLVVGAIYVAGILLFMSSAAKPKADHTTFAVGTLALTLLAAMVYAPFANRWFESVFETRWLRETLYSQRLEDLAEHMAVCRMGSRDRVADELVKIWVRNRLEPGWRARRMEPPPQFK